MITITSTHRKPANYNSIKQYISIFCPDQTVNRDFLIEELYKICLDYEIKAITHFPSFEKIELLEENNNCLPLQNELKDFFLMFTAGKSLVEIQSNLGMNEVAIIHLYQFTLNRLSKYIIAHRIYKIDSHSRVLTIIGFILYIVAFICILLALYYVIKESKTFYGKESRAFFSPASIHGNCSNLPTCGLIC